MYLPKLVAIYINYNKKIMKTKEYFCSQLRSQFNNAGILEDTGQTDEMTFVGCQRTFCNRAA